ncbi:MAG: (2Fe-2S)-binding protein [Alphaproteobacteria bacterium]|nr:(2Fe-2S)-binding protein [Alphaproteobacteria bacterium]
MKPAFRNLDTDGRRVRVIFDGRGLSLPEGENLAASLLAAGIHTFRETPLSGAPRAPFCMMGACYDCLVEIDGVVRQACLVAVREGMTIRKPHEPHDA